MRKTLLAMADGKFAFEQDELIISERRLEFICNTDEVIEGKFVIESSLGADIKGILYTTNYRMECRQLQFAGKKVEITYLFNARGLADKSTVKGDIYIETNIGEYNLPFVVTALSETVPSVVGTVRNLFHFANLAHTDYEQAYKLFVSKKFKNISMKASERMYYEMLVRTNPCRENMEEFLLAVNKKKPVRIQIEEKRFEEKYTGEDFAVTVTVKKNGWGYLKIDVSPDADFVRPQKPRIMAEDFVGDRAEYSLVIDGSRLHYGNNYARVRFASAVDEEFIEIKVNRSQEKKVENSHEIKEIKSRLCQLYIQVRTHAIHNLSWIRESKNLLERLMSLVTENKLLMLFHAQLLILDKKKEDAAFIMDRLKKDHYMKRQEPEVYAYLLYVEALSRSQEDFTVKAVSEVRALLENHPHSSKIFWVLMFLDDELQNNPVKKYRMLNEQFVYSCHSPFLYLETFLLLKSDVALLTSIQAFEKQVLSFALHQGLITEELALHTAKVSLLNKDYDVLLCRLLKNFYHLFENEKIAEAVCSQLIKGGVRDKDSFYWYELGVKAESKINLLYEYYLYTIPMDKKGILPKHLLLYFAYNQNVDYRHKAFLYANVTKYRDEITGIYEKYEPSISQFVEEQLLKKRVTEDLMYLYETHMDTLMEKEECCDILEELIFTCVIKCSGEKMRRIIVSYEELAKYDEFPVSDNKAYVRIYTDAAYIAAEDMSGRLHFETVDIEIKPLLTRSRITRCANRLNKKSTGILLNRYKKSGIVLEKEGVNICQRLLRKEEITDKFKEELLGRLISIFEERFDEEMVVNLLCKLDFENMEPVRRAEYIEKMIIYGMYDEAYEFVFKYGFEHINLKRLVRLCSRKISADCDEDRLVTLCSHVFLSGKYDEVMLEYLVSTFLGTTYEMIKLWNAANNFGVDSYKICERLLVQMLFTGFMPGKTVDIFEDYCNHGPKSEVVMAYISYLSYHYVVNEQVVEDKFFEYILKIYQRKEPLGDAALIAYIKYSSRKEKFTDKEKDFIGYAIKVLEKKGIRFAFFRKVERLTGTCSDLHEKTVIEHLTNPQNKVRLYYRIQDDGQDSVDFIKEELKPMLGPFFSRELTMFYGETLQYYITEQLPGCEECVVCSSLVRKEPHETENLTGCYGWIDEMYLSRSMEDEVSLIDLMRKYNKYKIVAERLFELKE